MKTKIILLVLIFSFAGLHAQQKAKLQKADESGFIEVDEVPVLMSKLKPSYPEIARLAGIEGTVYLKILVDENGNVDKTKVEQGAKEMLDNSAIQAAKKAKFSPAMLNNKPVKVWVILPIAFKLDVDKKSKGKLMKYDELGPPPSKENTEEPDFDKFVQYEKGPELIKPAVPVYPEGAKKNNITGKVFVKVLVDKEGNPKKAMVIKSEAEILNQSAIDAAMKSKFSPAMNEANPVAVWIVLPYKFELEGEKKNDKDGERVLQFDTVEKAKSYYQGYTYVHGNKKDREAISAPKEITFEKIEKQISFGDESESYKVTYEKKTKYAFIARKEALVYHYWAPTLEEIQRYVDDLKKKEK